MWLKNCGQRWTKFFFQKRRIFSKTAESTILWLNGFLKSLMVLPTKIRHFSFNFDKVLRRVNRRLLRNGFIFEHSYASCGKRQKSCTLIVILVILSYLTSPIFNSSSKLIGFFFFANEEVLPLLQTKYPVWIIIRHFFLFRESATQNY